MKKITDYTKQELEDKIKAIKVLCETAEEISKHCKEELERRKQKVPLGVPLPEKDGAPFIGVYELGFPSEKSFFEFSKRFQNYVTATRDNAKGEPIDIKVLLPLLPKGWVAMNKYKNEWVWHEKKPTCYKGAGLEYWESDGWKVGFLPFNLKPAEDWRNSLMEYGL